MEKNGTIFVLRVLWPEVFEFVCGNCLILFVTVMMFIGERWLSLLKLSEIDLSRQFCSEMSLQIDKNTFQ